MDDQNEVPRAVVSTPVRIARWLYGIIFWVALAIQILMSGNTLYFTITYDGWCGNPILDAWTGWFTVSLIVGLLVLPGGLWSFWHRKERAGAAFFIGFCLYLTSVVLTFIANLILNFI